MISWNQVDRIVRQRTLEKFVLMERLSFIIFSLLQSQQQLKRLRQYTTCAVFKSVSKITCTRNSRKNLFSVNLSRAGTKFERCKPAQEVWSIEVPRKKWPAPFSPFVEIWQLWKSVEVDWPGLEIKLAGCQTLWVNYQCSTINWSTAFRLKCYCNGLVS